MFFFYKSGAQYHHEWPGPQQCIGFNVLRWICFYFYFDVNPEKARYHSGCLPRFFEWRMCLILNKKQVLETRIICNEHLMRRTRQKSYNSTTLTISHTSQTFALMQTLCLLIVPFFGLKLCEVSDFLKSKFSLFRHRLKLGIKLKLKFFMLF